MARNPTRDKQILSHWPAKTMAEIAALLGLTKGVVAGVLNRAMRRGDIPSYPNQTRAKISRVRRGRV